MESGKHMADTDIRDAFVCERGSGVIELVVEVGADINLRVPDCEISRAGGTGWTVREYGEHFIRFDGPPDPVRFDNETLERRLARFNASGATEFAYFPALVSSDMRPTERVLFAPVPAVKAWLARHCPGWTLEPDPEACERGELLFRLARDNGPQIVCEAAELAELPKVVDAE